MTSIRPFIHDAATDYEYFGSFTPDGRSILFASQAACVFQAWLAPVDNPAAAVSVGEPSAITNGCITVGIIPWISPDGTRVLTAKADGANEDRVFLGGTDGAGAVPLDLTTSGWVTWQRVAP